MSLNPVDRGFPVDPFLVEINDYMRHHEGALLGTHFRSLGIIRRVRMYHITVPDFLEMHPVPSRQV